MIFVFGDSGRFILGLERIYVFFGVFLLDMFLGLFRGEGCGELCFGVLVFEIVWGWTRE